MTLYLKDATFLDWQTLEIKRTDLAVAEGSQGDISFPADPAAPGCNGPPRSHDRLRR